MIAIRYYIKLPLLICVLGAFLSSGCMYRSQTPQLYTLKPLKRPEAAYNFISKFMVSVGPVIMPDHLKRSQVVIRTSENQVSFSEFHKWAGSLKDDTKRVLAENLGILLEGAGGTVSTDDILGEPDYRVTVNINRFEGNPGDFVFLNAVWSIKDQKNRKIIYGAKTVFKQKVHGNQLLDMVNAQSLSLEALSIEIAAEIKKLHSAA